MSDGKITFSTRIDNSQIEKDLAAAKRKIEQATASIKQAESAKLPLTQQAKELGAALDAAKEKLYTMQQGGAAKSAVTEQKENVKSLQFQWDNVNREIDGYDRKIRKATGEVAANKEKVGELEAQTSKGGINMSRAMDKASKSAHSFNRRILSLAKRILVFSLVARAFRSIRTYMNEALNTSEEYRAQLAKLKGALITAFQPIYEYILPGIIKVLQVLTAVVEMFARIFSMFSGKSAKASADSAKAMNKEMKAIKGVGGAAKKAAKDLAGFDQINKLSSTDTGGGGGGGGITPVAPDFSDFTKDVDEGKLKRIAELVAAVALGLLGWKIASMFTSDLGKVAGIAMTIGGAFMYAVNWIDAFNNGVDWENLTGMVGGLALVAGGLALAFGHVGAAIGLIVGGLGLMVVGIKDWIDTGELTDEAFAAIEIGLLAIAGGISLLTGGPIPAIIAAVAGVVVAVVGRGQEIKAALQQLDDWLMGFFKKDWCDLFGPILGKPVNALFGLIGDILHGFKETLDGLIDFVQGVFTGNWKQAWEGIKEILKGVFDSLVAIFVNPLNICIDALNGFLRLVTSGVNKVIEEINKIPGVSLGTFSPPQIPTIPIPQLARGAVLPANNPFLAVVGDQRRGTNIEAPLETIQEAVANVFGGMEGGMMAGFESCVAVQKDILEAVLGIRIGDDVISNAVNRYNRKMSVMNGGGTL